MEREAARHSEKAEEPPEGAIVGLAFFLVDSVESREKDEQRRKILSMDDTYL